MKPELLLVDDNQPFRQSLRRALSRDYEVRVAACREEARGLLFPAPDAVLLDVRLDEADPANTAGIAFLREIREQLPAVPILMITAHGDIDKAVECMRIGAADFIQKGVTLTELRVRLEKALEQARLCNRVASLEQALAIVEPHEFIGVSRLIQEIRELIGAVARDGTISVLISGETGTGKEVVARAIHASGPRSERPMIAVSLASLPSATIESEVFGYERGAFTGADKRHIGLAERAHGGVLFLDEIAELPQTIQVKLLRFLEERAIHRLAGNQEIHLDVQILAATNADLPELIAQGRFREDLYYRLKVCEIQVPPLREHREDIPLLVQHFVAKLGGPKRGVVDVDADAIEALCRYAWPGNVRELRNVLEAALLWATLRKRRTVQREDLPYNLLADSTSAYDWKAVGQEGKQTPANLANRLARAELEQIQLALEQAHGRKADACVLLGLNDRFALRRRVLRIFDRYPELASLFPGIHHAFCNHA